eukprot:TRINITY_DN93456_c0_g1_i1.p1 TRINITY_DN93456_c0_g1~~TRINITY_DN93456_c0_g1_i1.p1  ORF type:complete len:508 (+),score=95.63 TRINITY_DN93456_c0_g1_i1:50-1525(+)
MASSQEDAKEDAPSPHQWHAGSRVDGVYVSFRGLKRVSPQVLVQECRILGEARTLGELQYALGEADSRLRELQLFKDITAEVSVEPSGKNTSEIGGLAEITWVIEERRRELSVSGNVDKQGEACCDVKVFQPALFGGPLSGTATLGTSSDLAKDFLLRLSTPRGLGRCAASFDLARSNANDSSACGYSEIVNQAVLRLGRSGAGLPLGLLGRLPGIFSWSCAADWSLRDLSPIGGPGRLPSTELQRARLQSLKTSLKQSVSWAWHPRMRGPGSSSDVGALAGARVRADLEAALPPGDVRFFRGEVQGEATWLLPELWPGFRLLGHLSGACGLLFPVDGRSCPQDRFRLGGASGSVSTIFKGFAHRGAEPHESCQPKQSSRSKSQMPHGDASGGNGLCTAFAAISAPVPASWGLPLEGSRMLMFCGAGALSPATRASACQFRGQLRASAGAGLVVPFGGSLLEFTFAQPFRSLPGDVPQRWQLGLRLQVQDA